MNLADRIQHLRKTAGISQEELADKMNVSRQAVSKWESGQSVPDLEKIIMLSERFSVTTDYLLKGIEPVAAGNQQAMQSANLGLMIIFATFAGIWSFTANRFHFYECILIVLAGAAIGAGVGIVVQSLSRLFANKQKAD